MIVLCALKVIIDILFLFGLFAILKTKDIDLD